MDTSSLGGIMNNTTLGNGTQMLNMTDASDYLTS